MEGINYEPETIVQPRNSELKNWSLPHPVEKFLKGHKQRGREVRIDGMRVEVGYRDAQHKIVIVNRK